MGRRSACLRVYLTRFQGVLSPRSKLRDYFVSQKPVDENENRKSTAYSMNWAQRLLPVAFTDKLDRYVVSPLCSKCYLK